MNKVSIIIPAYNVKDVILPTIESCLKQNPSIIKEVIIVDDHSTDDTWEVVQKTAKGHPVIKLVANKGKGANSARNFGYQLSSGEYIQFLDADDILSKDKINAQYEAIERDFPHKVAFCGWTHFTEDTNNTTFLPNAIWKDYDDPLKWLIDSWSGEGMMVTSCWLTPRTLIERAGLWDENLSINQDGEFFCRILLQAQKLKFVKEAKLYYRKPQKSNISQQKSKEAAADILKSYRLNEKNIRAQRDNEEVRLACASNYMNFIYWYYHLYPDLAKGAMKDIKRLKVKEQPKVGGKYFQLLSSYVGFLAALKVKAQVSRMFR
jgi:glycosyltransferase involved in cell wall biosynthesis